MDRAEAASVRWVGPGVRRALRILALLAGLGALLVLGRSAGGYLPAFRAWVDGLGAWGPVAFVGGYALATVAMVPGAALTLLGGAVFGVVRGTLYVFLGAVLGSALAFLVSRHLARPAVERRAAADPRFARMDRAVEREGRRIVFLLRLSPLLPFNLLNYALGLTRVRFADYLLASVGMLPGTLLYVYYGRLAGEMATLAAGTEVERGPEYYLTLGLGLAATAAATWTITRLARRALREETQGDGDQRE